jgi:hypothetical protein
LRRYTPRYRRRYRERTSCRVSSCRRRSSSMPGHVAGILHHASSPGVGPVDRSASVDDQTTHVRRTKKPGPRKQTGLFR